MALLTLSDLQLAFGHVALLDHAAFSLEAGERVALIGRNGAGKSSLLKIMAGLERPDDGTVHSQQGLRTVFVAQEPSFPPGLNLFDAVSLGLAEVLQLHRDYEAALQQLEHAGEASAASAAGLTAIDALQSRLEALDGWNWESRVQDVLQRLHLDGSLAVDACSGGMRKRVALAQALVARPDVLLLDEPTNHLDLDAILWLQTLLSERAGALIFISHDRAFVDAVATRIVELDRGQLRSYPGNFAAYEATKARELESEALANARADKLLAQEEVWIRKGVEARRTRSVSRISRLQALRAQRAARREQLGQVRLELASGLPSGKIVAELQHVGFRHGDTAPWLLRDFTATILRGDKVGLIGPNGAGKTTLLRLILGEATATEGNIRLGTQRQVAYFDQMRASLQLDATLADTISPGSEWVEINGGRKHVNSYLSDFLFSPARAESPVRTLSGGERNRLLLARLFALPANVLVLDEPTNDLDVETLELLEELLQQYRGTVFLVSHDRRFVDNVVTSTIAWEGDPAQGGRPGQWREYEGGITDWLTQRERSQRMALSAPVLAPVATSAPTLAPASVPAPPPAATTAPSGGLRRVKLSYREQRELDTLPLTIEQLESEQSDIQAQLADGSLYATDHQRASELTERLTAIDDALLDALERWEALEARKAAG